ncbi:MAG: hypothetical protein GXP41_05220 [Chloroflexi bacterium]|nr:hypothetical protein [Chloroflexota bacterium]
MAEQQWLLGISNTFHLIATLVWVGWSALLGLYVAPQPSRAFAPAPSASDSLAASLTNRLNRLAYLAMAVLIVTGLLQMSMNPNYAGFLQVQSAWAILIAAKHLAVGLSIVLVFYLNFATLPDLRYHYERAIRLGEEADVHDLEQRFRLLALLNFAFAVLILLFTGLATAIVGPASSTPLALLM